MYSLETNLSEDFTRIVRGFSAPRARYRVFDKMTLAAARVWLRTYKRAGMGHPDDTGVTRWAAHIQKPTRRFPSAVKWLNVAAPLHIIDYSATRFEPYYFVDRIIAHRQEGMIKTAFAAGEREVARQARKTARDARRVPVRARK